MPDRSASAASPGRERTNGERAAVRGAEPSVEAPDHGGRFAVDPDELRAVLERMGGGAVEERETHISWVFLVGDRAYKLKKPLVLPFLDYGTAARRRQMCREEVRLNRRLAPSIYLAVRAVIRTAFGIELGGEDDPRAIDFLVEMRRYDEARTLAASVKRGEASAAEIVTVGRTLADFHAQCERVDRPQHGAHRAERDVGRNVIELLAVAEARGERARIRTIARFMSAFVGSREHEFDERARSGCVRECHGDLRAEHVVLETPLEVVDCVEFDPSLRTLDVADDLAFMVMDLTRLGSEGLSAPLVESYRAAGGRPGDGALIAFFAVHRALVRAKVLLVRASQHPPGSDDHERLTARAHDLVDLAERLSWRARLPLVIVICGLPASGKSHLAAEIAKRSGLTHLSSDVTRKRLAGRRPTEPATLEHYASEFSQATYSELGSRAASEVGRSGGALIDATFRLRRDRDAFARAFADTSPLLFVQCLAPAKLLLERARAREQDPARVSDAGVEIVMRERDSWEPLDELTPSEHVTLRTDRPVEEIAGELAALLDQRL